MLTKREAEKLMKTKGKVRGLLFKIDRDFILEEKGEEGVKKVETKMVELGFPVDYKNIIRMDFYPIGLIIISRLISKDLFNFNDDDLRKWGSAIVKFSLLIKIFMNYFSSLNLIAKQVSAIWQRHYSIGDLEMPEYNEKERHGKLKLRNRKFLCVGFL